MVQLVQSIIKGYNYKKIIEFFLGFSVYFLIWYVRD